MVKNSRGMGIVGVMAAAAIVVAIAMIVSQFVSDQNKQLIRLEVSGSCQNIANSIVEYLKKDESSIFISSYGPLPGTAQFPQGLDQTEDGLDRFVFSGTKVSLFTTVPGKKIKLSTNAQLLPQEMKSFNHLNIKNSTNRLIALAANGNYCCDGLNMNSSNCGEIFYSDKVLRPNLKLAEKNVEVKLAVDFRESDNTSMCSGRTLATKIPDSKYTGPTHFKIRVKLNPRMPNEKICEAQGTVQRNSDTEPSLTLMQLESESPTTLCGDKSGLPSTCNRSTPVRVRVKTVKNSNLCIERCLQKITNYTCATLPPDELNTMNTFTHTACATNCQASEPGSAFLCKVGEKNWFKNMPKDMGWEPCERARVKDHNGNPIGKLSIKYEPLITGNTQSQVTTHAVITMTDLESPRAYVVDVRAVDTNGNVGPSFCNSSPSCSDNALPHFSVISYSPTLSPLVDAKKFVGLTGLTSQEGRDNTLTAKPKYSSALNLFGAKNFQCKTGDPQFVVQLDYDTPPGAYAGIASDSCSAVLTDPHGTNASSTCLCSKGFCFSTARNILASGNHKFTMTVKNDCGGSGTTTSIDWCSDVEARFDLDNATSLEFHDVPDFSGQIRTPPTKICGLVTLCPNLDGTFTPTLGQCSKISDWSKTSHSGCLADPKGNYCVTVVDPCGRYAQTKTIQYSTSLLSAHYESTLLPRNYCFKYESQPVGGNACHGQAYCSRSGKCFVSCPKEGKQCAGDTDCDETIFAYLSTNTQFGPRCSSGKCTCPTNKDSPSLTDCGPKYCPTMSSCLADIGNSRGGSGACVIQ